MGDETRPKHERKTKHERDSGLTDLVGHDRGAVQQVRQTWQLPVGPQLEGGVPQRTTLKPLKIFNGQVWKPLTKVCMPVLLLCFFRCFPLEKKNNYCSSIFFCIIINVHELLINARLVRCASGGGRFNRYWGWGDRSSLPGAPRVSRKCPSVLEHKYMHPLLLTWKPCCNRGWVNVWLNFKAFFFSLRKQTGNASSWIFFVFFLAICPSGCCTFHPDVSSKASHCSCRHKEVFYLRSTDNSS